eukprot:IDg21020t1
MWGGCYASATETAYSNRKDLSAAWGCFLVAWTARQLLIGVQPIEREATLAFESHTFESPTFQNLRFENVVTHGNTVPAPYTCAVLPASAETDPALFLVRTQPFDYVSGHRRMQSGKNTCCTRCRSRTRAPNPESTKAS